MADLLDFGFVKVIALKKCGSSQFGKAFRDRQFLPYPPHKYVTAIRHPAARLQSLWWGHVRHAIKRPNGSNRDDRVVSWRRNPLHTFGPPVPFPEWIEWVLSNQLDQLDVHIRPQYLCLADKLREAPIGSKLWICQLERLTPLHKELSEFVGQPVCVLNKKRHPHGPWVGYYDRDLLERVRKAYAHDLALWLWLWPNGYEVLDAQRASIQLDKREPL